MEKNVVTDGKILRQWLDKIPFGEYNNVIERLVRTCLVSRGTFNNWRYDACRIPMAAKRDINSVTVELTGEKIFEIVEP